MILLDLQKDSLLKHHLNLPLVGLIHVDFVADVLRGFESNMDWRIAAPCTGRSRGMNLVLTRVSRSEVSSILTTLLTDPV